jgi:hypothetical protein
MIRQNKQGADSGRRNRKIERAGGRRGNTTPNAAFGQLSEMHLALERKGCNVPLASWVYSKAADGS